MTLPTTYDEALSQRDALIGEIERITYEIAGKHAGDPERATLLKQLAEVKVSLRNVKDWLRLHDPLKESEWRLLGRAYRLLGEIQEGKVLEEEIEALLDAIEIAVPKKHLEETP